MNNDIIDHPSLSIYGNCFDFSMIVLWKLDNFTFMFVFVPLFQVSVSQCGCIKYEFDLNGGG